MVGQFILLIVALFIPVLTGIAIMKKDRTVTLSFLVEAVIAGAFVLWAVFQILATSFQYFRLPFTTLYYVFLTMSLLFSAWGMVKLHRRKWALRFRFPKTPLMWLVLILAIGVIGLQVYMYVFGMHLDEDDARWLAEANDALVHNTMFLHNPATGAYLGHFAREVSKDCFSPWPMFIATMSKFTGFNTAVMAHTILAPLLLLFSYLLYDQIGRQLYENRDERIIFLFAVSVIMLFFYGASDSEAAFSLIRIWQGKAIVAGVTIPGLFLQMLRIQNENTTYNWLMLAVMGCASCLFSGMGVVISLIMIGGYGLYILAFRKQWKRIPFYLLALAAPALFELLTQMVS